MARRSRTEVPHFGSAARQKVIDDMHAAFLKRLEEQQQGSGRDQGVQDLAVDTAEVEGRGQGDVAEWSPGTPPVAGSSRMSTAEKAAPFKEAEHSHSLLGAERVKSQPDAVDAVPADRGDYTVRRRLGGSSPRTLRNVFINAPQPFGDLPSSPPAAGLTDKTLTALAVLLSLMIAAVLLKKIVVAMGVVQVAGVSM